MSGQPIRVVDVRKLRTPEERAGVVYVGRMFAGWPASVFANPFKPKTRKTDHGILPAPGAVEECLTKYRAYLATAEQKSPNHFALNLAALWEETGHGTKPLGCWCVSAVVGDGQACVCHAQILAELLHERFGGKESENKTPPQDQQGHLWKEPNKGQTRCVNCDAYRHLGSGIMICRKPASKTTDKPATK